jgi:hypothetical protein
MDSNHLSLEKIFGIAADPSLKNEKYENWRAFKCRPTAQRTLERTSEGGDFKPDFYLIQSDDPERLE